MSIVPKDLEEIIHSWSYWCPDRECRNRTFTIESGTNTKLYVSSEENGDSRYLTVRVLVCERCKTPTVIGTHAYHNKKAGWGARGEVITSSNAKMSAAAVISGRPLPYQAQEYIAFIEPVQERPLPKKVSKKISESFREAEYAIDKNKSISAAAAIRNTIRLIVEDNKITKSNLKQAIKELPFHDEYIKALGNMKIMGDDTLHYEEYSISELKPALESLYLALEDYYAHKDRLTQLHKAVSDKASKKGKNSR